MVKILETGWLPVPDVYVWPINRVYRCPQCGAKILLEQSDLENRDAPTGKGDWTMIYCPASYDGRLCLKSVRVEPVLQLTAEPEYPPLPPIAPEELQVMLLMVAEPIIPLEVLQAWTQEQREEAGRWAGAVHLYASDHDDIEVPEKPAWVTQAEEQAKGEGDAKV